MLSAHVALSYLLLPSHTELAAIHIREARRLAETDANSNEMLEAVLVESLLYIQQGHPREAESGLLKLVQHSSAAPSFRWEAENTLAGIYDKTGRGQEAEEWYRRAIATFHGQRLTLKSVESELPFLENGSDLYMGYMEHLIRAGRTGEALRLLDTSRAETLAEGLGTKPLRAGPTSDARAVAGRLGATILVYCLRPERSYLWAITGKREEFYTLPGSGAILPLVQRHNQAILAAKDLLAPRESTGRALYDALLAPAAGLLPQGGGRVILVADSSLSRLNFETLIAPGPVGGKPHYWIEDVSVTNARSLRLLAGGSPQALKPVSPSILLIGDPVYPKEEYAPLPHAGAEMAQIAGHFGAGERVVAAGREASPEAYVASRPGRFRFLHFVAHATASELNPLDSAVILSSNPKSEGGVGGSANKLYASEILKEPLSAELVTLSSCYGSGVRDYTGEGVVGLAWAFLRAGAHSVIGALWEVSDVATPKLMDTLYTRLRAGASPDAALREAKLEMVRGDGVFRKPIYWASFQLYTGR